MNSRYYKLYKTISFWYAVVFFYKLIHQYFVFLPVVNSVRKTDLCNEIYFSNEMGGYVWPPTESSTPLYEKTLFYLNNLCGNCSTRFGLIHRLQREFPSYTIVQLDYPGFGISYRLDLNINEIIYRTHETLQIILKTNNVKSFGFWTEELGIYILAKILYNDQTLRPSFLLCHNITNTFWEYYKNQYTFLCLPFLGPCLTYPTVSFLLNNTKIHETIKIALFYDEKKQQEKISSEQWYALEHISFSKKFLIPLSGSGISCFFLPENESNITSYVRKLL